MEKKKSYPSHKKINLVGKIVLKEGKPEMVLNSRDLYYHFLKNECKIGDDIYLELTSKRPKRTLLQNAYLHVYLGLVSISSGHTIKELKEYIHANILSKGVKEMFGKTTKIYGHTSELNISEFCEMMNKLEEDTDIPLPDPTPFNLPLTMDEYHRLVVKEKDKYRLMKPKKSFIKKVAPWRN